uniref:Mucin-1 n=1 Tax=Aquila chrysaetos chrysaetos TaxID=223781 RepID=A0A663ELY9_AQUCH
METTIKTTTTPTTTTLNVTISKNTSGNGTQTSVSSYTTVFPATGNTTNFQSSNSSAGNTTANSTAVPVSSSTAISHTNTTANSSNWVPYFGTNTTSNSFAVPTSATGGGTVIPTSSTKGNKSSSTQVVLTWRTVTTQGSMAPRETPTAVLGSSGSPNPSKTTALLPTAVQLLLHISLSFRIVNRRFNESLRDPTSKEYRSLSHTVLTMTTCTCRRKSRGKLDLFSTKDSYHPMAEYPPYQSHGRYVSPNSKPNPYSQVRADNGAGAGTFTYTDPAAASDNL